VGRFAGFFQRRAIAGQCQRDHSIRVWRTSDWQGRPRCAAVKKRCGGNFHPGRPTTGHRFLGAITGPIWTERTVLVWDVASGKELARLRPHRDEVGGLDFSPDGTVLATASYDNTCKLFDLRLQPPKEITRLPGHLSAPLSVCFSPDGRRLAAGLAGGSIITWDLETGREVLVLKTHADNINQVQFHPNIAKVLDAGATEAGRPYFVMELVKGIPITQYCQREKLAMGERLDLFIKVCHAIQHAHQKGIIHRDIKPSNIVVTLHDGVPVPKVIDFGIAKATQQELTDKTVTRSSSNSSARRRT